VRRFPGSHIRRLIYSRMSLAPDVMASPIGRMNEEANRALRIAHVVPSIGARTGGPAITVVQTAIALNKAGVRAEIFTTNMGSPASATSMTRLTGADLAAADGVPLHIAIARHPLRLAYAPGLRRALSRSAPNFDVIHIHSLFLYPQYAAFAVAKRFGIPYVVSLRGALDPYLRRRGRVRKAITGAIWQDRMLAGAAALHLTSRRELELVSDIAPKVPRVVISNPVDWRDYEHLPDPKVFTERFLDGRSSPIIMYFGRVSQKKGIHHLVSAFAKIAPEHPDAILAIVGPDDEGLTGELRSLSNELGISSRTKFVGQLSGQDKAAALASATVWVLPSATENFGIAVVEALAAGAPVIVSPGVNIAQELGEMGACIVCEPDASALAVQISALLRDPLRRSQLSKSGRIAARQFSIDVVVPQLKMMYDSVVRPGRSGREPDALSHF